MAVPSVEYVRRYQKRTAKEKRRYFYEKVVDKKRSETLPTKNLFQEVIADIKYLALWNLNIILVIKAYGKIIRENYGISFFRQYKRMVYMLFVKRLTPLSFRSYMLFKEPNWRMRDLYTYEHYESLMQLATISSFEEIEMIKNKYNLYKFCKQHDIKTPKVLAVFQDGKRTDDESRELQLPEKDLFIKELYGKAGWGLKKLLFSDGKYLDLNGSVYTSCDIENYMISGSRNNQGLMIQELMENHDSWKPFTPGGLSTCRLVTAKSPDDQKIIPLYCTFRMPVNNSDGDNYAIGGIATQVNLTTGQLGRGVRKNPALGKFEFDNHPTTNLHFKDTVLPYWKDLIEFSSSAHKHFNTIFIGWDVSMTTRGCYLIEANLGWGSDGYEVSSQMPISKTLFPELYERWMEKYSELDGNQ